MCEEKRVRTSLIKIWKKESRLPSLCAKACQVSAQDLMKKNSQCLNHEEYEEKMKGTYLKKRKKFLCEENSGAGQFHLKICYFLPPLMLCLPCITSQPSNEGEISGGCK